MFNRLLNAYRSRRLTVELALGRKQLGRQPGAVTTATVPIRAVMSARVIRADGSVEDLGVIGEAERDVPDDFLDDLRKQAEG